MEIDTGGGYGAPTPGSPGAGALIPNGAIVRFSAQSFAGWNQPAAIYEFPAGRYPAGWPCPAGWTDNGAGSYQYVVNAITGFTPPPVTFPAAMDTPAWGTWLPRLVVNGGGSGLTDESCGIRILSTNGIAELASGEDAQFGGSARGYPATEQNNERIIDQGLVAIAGGGVLLGAGTPAVVHGGAGTQGALASAAPFDHRHQVLTGAPTDIGTANAAGSGNPLALANHVHRLTFAVVASALSGASTAISINGQKLSSVGAPTTGTDAVNKTYADALVGFASIQAALAGATGPVDFNGVVLTGLGAPVAGTDAATKAYVDAGGNLPTKVAARGASLADQPLTGALTEDGITYTTGDRYLAKNQAAPEENGIYVVNTGGAWARAADADTSAEVTPGLTVAVLGGTVNGKTGWALLITGTITLGTTALPFTQVFGAGSYLVDADGSVILGTTGKIKVGALATDAQHGARGGGTQHAAVVASGANGFMLGTDKQIIDNATAAPAAGKLTKYGASAELTAAFFSDSGTAATTGIVRCSNNTVAVAAKDSGGNDCALLGVDNTDLLSVGDQARVANMTCKVKTGGAFNVTVNGTSRLTVNATSISPNGNKITNVGAPAAATDAATKGYADGLLGFSFLNIVYTDVVAAASAAQTVMFININNGGAGAGCPTGAVALGCRYQLNARFVAAGATLIKISIGVPSSHKQFVDVPVDSTSPTPSTPYASFGGDDYFADISAQFFQVRLEVTGLGVDLTMLTAGDLVVRCAHQIPTLI